MKTILWTLAVFAVLYCFLGQAAWWIATLAAIGVIAFFAPLGKR